MKRLLILFASILVFASCSNTNQGELVGVRKHPRAVFYQPLPYGMVYIPQGSYTMGAGAEDITYGFVNPPKTVSVQSFYMDQTEITNNEYREFVYWVRDSIARTILGEQFPDKYLITENPKTGEIYDPAFLNWKEPIQWVSKDQAVRDALEEMYLPVHERFFGRKQIDTRKLYYDFYWIDLKAAAKKDFSSSEYRAGSWSNRAQGMSDRSVYIRKERINIYPDTLSWVHDYAYSFNDPMTETYFWHPAYDHYPVVGVNWTQARAFCDWRTHKQTKYLKSRGSVTYGEFRLPTEAEWEWAARGGHHLNPYPWGGPYTRNSQGCFLANFKPVHGNYIGDGGLRTVIVAHYPANDFGLYDMSGNVAEWTGSAFDPSTYNYSWDMNPDYVYSAKENDPPILKRKVVRGGSWKDISYYLQVGTRTYEYQDTAKCYIGFRCVQHFLGRQMGDSPEKSSRVYR